MKKTLVKLIRMVLSAGLVVAWFQGVQALIAFHYDCCPELYSTPINTALLFVPLLFIILLTIFPIAAIQAASGYKLQRIHWLFLEITKPNKLRIRLTKKCGFTVRMLPPRTDGTSPYMLYWCSGYLCAAALCLLCTLLAALCWRTPASRYMNNAFLATGLWTFLMPLLPTKNNALDRVLALRKSQDLRRAWECSMHMTAASERKVKLQDMPEEWFLPYPAELADYPLVRPLNFNRASRLINQDRLAEGYEILRYFFDLKPTPQTHGMIAMAILNGVMCEALGDLPPMCMSQLDHPSLKLPLPPEWESQRMLAEYARALFLHHDEAEAAAILPKLEAAFAKEDRPLDGIEKLQRKAGLLTDDKGEEA